MKKVIFTLSLFVVCTLTAGHYLYQFMPQPISTVVIAAKPDKAVGDQLAVVVPKNLTEKQKALLDVAYSIAKKDGHKDPEIVQSVLLQETRAGTMKKYKVANEEGEPYYGLMQLKLGATKDILKKFPALYDQFGFQTRADDEIKANLILNERFNMQIGSLYLLHLRQVYGYTGRELMNAYNRGAAGVKRVGSDYHYGVEAQKKLAAYKVALK